MESFFLIPESENNYNKNFFTIPELVKSTKVDRSTIKRAIDAGVITGTKDCFKNWKLEKKSVINYFEFFYRYKNYNKFTGQWWTKKEIIELYSSDSNQEIGKRINRSCNSVKVMRSKLKISHYKEQNEEQFFITPHAVERYKKRIIDIPAKYIIWNIIDGLKRKILIELSKHEGATYFCKSRHSLLNFFTVVIKSKNERWDQVVTVFNENENKYNRDERKI